MLTLLRNLTRSKFALVIIGLLIVSLAAWGVTDIFTAGNTTSLATVGSRTIETSDVNRFADNIIASNREEGVIVTRQDLADGGQLPQILNLMVNDDIIAEYLTKKGLRASITAGAATIRDAPVFRDSLTGAFDRDRFREYLARQQISPSKFEKDVRDDLTRAYFNNALGAALDVPEPMGEIAALYRTEQRKIAYFQIDPRDLPEPVAEPTDEEVAAFYAEQTAALTRPERRAFSLLSLSPEDFLHRVEISEEDLRAEYDAQTARYSEPSTRTLRQLVYSDREVADNAFLRLSVGDTVEAVSADYPALEDTTVQTMEADMEDPLIAGRVFTTPVGQWAPPLQQNNGWVVTRVVDETPGAVRPFETVREEIALEIRTVEADRLFFDAFERLDDAVGGGLPIDEISAEIGAPVLRLPPVDREGFTEDGVEVRSLTNLDEALSYGFTLFTGEMSDRREGETAQYIIQVDNIIEAEVPPLAEIETDLRALLKRQATDAALQTFAEEIAARIRDGSGFIDQEAAALEKTVSRPPQGLTRSPQDGGVFPPNAVTQVFNTGLDKPFIGQLANGKLIGVVEAIDLPEADIRTQLGQAFASQLEQQIVQDALSAFAESARESVDVQVNAARLQAYIDENKSPE